MATPVAAGTAAILRQYFEDGFYPTGERNPSDAMDNPSGALIKAVMMNGAQVRLHYSHRTISMPQISFEFHSMLIVSKWS